jgi:Co/Zn/Cd efflux system component
MRDSSSIEHRWLLNNIAFIALLGVGLWGTGRGTGCADLVVASMVALVCLFRTWGDYKTAWAIYFPEQPHGTDLDAEAGSVAPAPAGLPG